MYGCDVLSREPFFFFQLIKIKDQEQVPSQNGLSAGKIAKAIQGLFLLHPLYPYPSECFFVVVVVVGFFYFEFLSVLLFADKVGL